MKKKVFFSLGVIISNFSLQMLLHACIEKQDRAWRLFIQEFDQVIQGTAIHYTNGADSKDIAQIVYWKLLEEDCKRLKNFTGDSIIAFKAYLIKITRYVCLAEWKKKKRDAELLEPEQLETIPQSKKGQNTKYRPDLFLSAISQPEEEHLLLEEDWKDALMQLSLKERECIQWLKLGYKYHEIAEMMGVPLGTISPLGSQAKGKLARIFKDKGWKF
ncbi:MAG: RNA polymerase sigma factor [Leptospiraceae bacterium]|nr:RNA polymerase sigma factor [Leptospiraceae bacterium]